MLHLLLKRLFSGTRIDMRSAHSTKTRCDQAQGVVMWSLWVSNNLQGSDTVRCWVHSRARDRNFGKIFWSRAHGRDEETLLSSRWTLIGSELSSPKFNSSIRAEWSFTIRYLNVVIMPLCGNLDIWLITRLTTTFSRGILFTCFRSQIATESERYFFGSRAREYNMPALGVIHTHHKGEGRGHMNLYS